MVIFTDATKRIIAKWNAITRKNGKTPNAVIYHIAVSQRNTKSLHGFFSSTTTGCSHLFVANDGSSEQYIDADKRSSADVQGGDRTISVETAGGYGDDLNAPWSDAQVETLAQIAAWANRTYGVPLREMKDSKPSSTGIGFHRLGVPRSKWTPASEPGWLVPGGEVWSGAVGKVCPGDARMAQIPAIIERAKQIVAGNTKPPAPKPGGGGTAKPTPPVKPVSYEWPGAILRVDGDNGPITRRAYQRLLKGIKLYTGLVDADLGRMFTKAEQTWLKGLGFYKGKIDSVRGPMTRKALQSFLKSKNLYTGRIDGDLGKMSISALQRYLNQQRKYF